MRENTFEMFQNVSNVVLPFREHWLLISYSGRKIGLWGGRESGRWDWCAGKITGRAAQSLCALFVFLLTSRNAVSHFSNFQLTFAQNDTSFSLIEVITPLPRRYKFAVRNNCPFSIFWKRHSPHLKNRPACWDTHIGHEGKHIWDVSKRLKCSFALPGALIIN